MKIAFLVPSFPTVSETFILNQIVGLIDKGHDVNIITFKKNRFEKVHDLINEYDLMGKTIFLSEGMPSNYVKRIFTSSFLLLRDNKNFKINRKFDSINLFKYGTEVMSLKYLYSLNNYFKTLKFDIIHAQYGPLGVGALVLKDIGVIDGKVVTSFRGFDMSHILKGRERKYEYLFEKGDCFLPVCQYFENHLINKGCPSDNVLLHYSGVDTSKFAPRVHKNISTKVKILTTGRLEKKKGLEYSIRAVAEMYKNNKNIEYIIIGDGSQKKKLQKLIDKLNANSYIHILGSKKQNEVISYLNEADVFIAPSITTKRKNIEGIPNAIKEAMLVGVPVISTFHSGIPEIISHNVSGILVEEKNYTDIVNSLNWLLRNPTKIKSIVKQASKEVRETFETKHLNDVLEKIYLDLINS